MVLGLASAKQTTLDRLQASANDILVNSQRGRYNCYTYEVWSDEKTRWCCERRGIGCPTTTCPVNEEYKTCGTACEPSCDNRFPMCTLQCVEGCFCERGFVRNANGLCVPEYECPAETCTCGEPCSDGRGTCQSDGRTCAFNIIPPNCGATCPANEHFNDCGSACEPTCDDPFPTLCTLQCVPGCFCDPGFVRRQDGVCVAMRECPAERCPANELYQECGTACEPTCDDPFPICIEQCVAGCFCEPGFVREGGVCVAHDECPTLTCGANEEFKPCGTACEPTCDDRSPFCTKQCVAGCFCERGFIRQNGVCVPENQCPTNTCGANEEFKGCGTACEPTCDNRSPICTLQCVAGCFCEAGFIRQNGVCVPENQCPTETCPVNEEYKECGTACEPSCDNPFPALCTQQCVEGCFCERGLVRGADGVCVALNECPTATCSGANEEFKECGTACEPTCDNRSPMCTRQCVAGCFCERGYIRQDGACVPENQCPTEICSGANEEFKECGTACEPTCDNQSPICTLQCVAGCFCERGFIRQNGVCVPRDQCPAGCVLTGGALVADGYSGPDGGDNYCNTCNCSNGDLTCTEMACEVPPPYNCYTREVWTDEKKQYCCETERIGCPEECVEWREVTTCRFEIFGWCLGGYETNRECVRQG